MSTLYGITRHLNVKPSLHKANTILLENLYTKTRITISNRQWPILSNFEHPSERRGDIWEKRAILKQILVPLDNSQPIITPPWLSTLKEVVFTFITRHQRKPGLNLKHNLDVLTTICRPDKSFSSDCYFLWRDPERVFRSAIRHLKVFLGSEHNLPRSTGFDTEFIRLAAKRPLRKESLEQQCCTLATSLDRIDLVKKHHPAGSKILILGDDDLLSLVFRPEDDYDIKVYEYDIDLLNFLSHNSRTNIDFEQRDLFQGLPEEVHGAYDAVITDPMYEARGMTKFITCCAQALKPSPTSRLYISTCPELLEDKDRFFNDLSRHNFTILQTLPNFNRYPFPPDEREGTRQGLIELGYDQHLVEALLQLPYLYADLFICSLNP